MEKFKYLINKQLNLKKSNNLNNEIAIIILKPNFKWKSETELTKRSLNSFLWTLLVFAKVRIIWIYCK